MKLSMKEILQMQKDLHEEIENGNNNTELRK